MLIRLRGYMTGAIAESALEGCGIVVSKSRVPGDHLLSAVTSGLCIGTGSMAQRNVDAQGCRQVVDLVCRVLSQVTPLGTNRITRWNPLLLAQFRSEVETLCRDYPLADYQ